ncbi:MAG TPA: adenosine deaminase [Thermoleophilia bacterium]|nr:adenosine deaminase [Thermoleophilia bacterium]
MDLSGADLATFVRGLPKAELHLHIEGTLEPELMLELGARNGVDVAFGDAAEARAAYRFTDLRSFLNLYYRGMEVLRTQGDFRELTAAYLRHARADGTRHVEVFFDPQSHLVRGVDFGDVVAGIHAALEDGERELGISSRLIMCFLRDQSPHGARGVLDLALPYRDLIAGVGLDSAELGHPPGEFAGVFAAARAAGFVTVAHAGEEGPAAYVAEALDLLDVERVDHGVHAADDPVLVTRLRDERVPLTMCPLSNLRLGVVADLAEHPLKRLLDAGVAVTVNSDDPAYFGGYLVDNYLAAADALGLTPADLVALARNSLDASLLDGDERRRLLDELDGFVAASVTGQ